MAELEQLVEIRLATPDDAPIIARQRTQMFLDMGSATEEISEALIRASVEYHRRVIERGEYTGWLAAVREMSPRDMPSHVVGSVGALVRQIPPFPFIDAAGNRSVAMGKQALVVNMYVEPSWRRRGLAERLMMGVLAWSRREKIDRLVLHASAEGKSLYEKLGFVMTNEMRLAPSATIPPATIPA